MSWSQVKNLKLQEASQLQWDHTYAAALPSRERSIRLSYLWDKAAGSQSKCIQRERWAWDSLYPHIWVLAKPPVLFALRACLVLQVHEDWCSLGHSAPLWLSWGDFVLPVAQVFTFFGVCTRLLPVWLRMLSASITGECSESVNLSDLSSMSICANQHSKTK